MQCGHDASQRSSAHHRQRRHADFPLLRLQPRGVRREVSARSGRVAHLSPLPIQFSSSMTVVASQRVARMRPMTGSAEQSIAAKEEWLTK
jgi:hypothetical protein